MAEDGQSRANAVSLLMPAAQYAGLPDREIESTIDSAFRIASRLGPGSRLGPHTGMRRFNCEHARRVPPSEPPSARAAGAEHRSGRERHRSSP